MKRYSVVCAAEKFIAATNTNDVQIFHDVNVWASDEDVAHGVTVRSVMRQMPGYRIGAISVKEIA